VSLEGGLTDEESVGSADMAIERRGTELHR
jgi:hypothetical protein